MQTISLCMIVKNEEAVLARCLDTVADLMDEIIIVDTGSTDRTKDIASRYTDKIYDFEWIKDFSAARNYSFSLATMDYIYAPDADELLDEVNRERFKLLKECLDPQVELVQMKYITESNDDAVMNVKKEYRPKLFKRLRTFTWIDPIHETVRLNPVVFNSDIEIIHRPQSSHAKRDFSIFVQEIERAGMLSDKLRTMYARELLKAGDLKDFDEAIRYFYGLWLDNPVDDAGKEAACVLAKYARLNGKASELMKFSLRDMLDKPCSEICLELGKHYLEENDFEEAIVWFVNAYSETESILDIHSSGDEPLKGLIECYDNLIKFMDTKINNLKKSEYAAPELMDEFIDQQQMYRDSKELYEEALTKWTIPEEL